MPLSPLSLFTFWNASYGYTWVFELVPFEVAVADAGRTTVGKLMFTVANSRPLLESSGVLAVPGILSEVHQNALKLLYVGM